jgi:hypothetical protein
MNRRFRQILLATLSFLLVLPGYSQGPISQLLQPNKEKSIQPAAPDPLGRETPNDTLFGF